MISDTGREVEEETVSDSHSDHVVSWVRSETNSTLNSRPVMCSEYIAALERALQATNPEALTELHAAYGFSLTDELHAEKNPDWY